MLTSLLQNTGCEHCSGYHHNALQPRAAKLHGSEEDQRRGSAPHQRGPKARM